MIGAAKFAVFAVTESPLMSFTITRTAPVEVRFLMVHRTPEASL